MCSKTTSEVSTVKTALQPALWGARRSTPQYSPCLRPQRVARGLGSALHTRGNNFRRTSQEAHLAGGGECGPSSTWPSKAPSAPPPPPHPHFVRPVSSIFPAVPGVGSQFHSGLAGKQVLWREHGPRSDPWHCPQSSLLCRDTGSPAAGTGWLVAHPESGCPLLGPALPAAAPSDPRKHEDQPGPTRMGRAGGCVPCSPLPSCSRPTTPAQHAKGTPFSGLPSGFMLIQWPLLLTF